MANNTTFDRGRLREKLKNWGFSGKSGDPLVAVALFHMGNIEPVDSWIIQPDDDPVHLASKIEEAVRDDAANLEGHNTYTVKAFFAEAASQISVRSSHAGARYAFKWYTAPVEEDERDQQGDLKADAKGWSIHLLRNDLARNKQSADNNEFIIRQMRAMLDEREQTIIKLSAELSEARKSESENIRIYNDMLRMEAKIKQEEKEFEAKQAQKQLMMEKGLLMVNSIAFKLTGGKVPMMAGGGNPLIQGFDDFIKTITPESLPAISAAFSKPGQWEFLQRLMGAMVDGTPQGRIILLAGLPDFAATIDEKQIPAIMAAFPHIGQQTFIATILNAFVPEKMNGTQVAQFTS